MSAGRCLKKQIYRNALSLEKRCHCDCCRKVHFQIGYGSKTRQMWHLHLLPTSNGQCLFVKDIQRTMYSHLVQCAVFRESNIARIC